MMKPGESVKSIERDLLASLPEVLAEVPFVRVRHIEHEFKIADQEIDGLIDIVINGEPFKILIEVKASGQPRIIRRGIEQIRRASEHFPGPSILMMGAAYLPEAARRLCVDEAISYLDLVGNCRIIAPGVFIDRKSDEKPKIAQREIKSVFAPKSAQILRALLREPDRSWKVVDLAEASGTSLGQVSNVRRAIIDREWASADEDGLQLTDRTALLDAWRISYTPPVGERRDYYTTLHGKALDQALALVLPQANQKGHAAAMSFTAADWLAPYTRVPKTYLTADTDAVPTLTEGLMLRPVTKGANVQIFIPDDPEYLDDIQEVRPTLWATSTLRTFLDLAVSGERGNEAADILLEKASLW